MTMDIPGLTYIEPLSDEALRDLRSFADEGLLSEEDRRMYQQGLITSDQIFQKVDEKIQDLLDELGL